MAVSDEIILKHALKNAFLHSGKANVGAVMNKVIGELGDASGSPLQAKTGEKDLKTLGKEIKKIVDKVNKMKVDEQEKELLKLDSHALDKKEEKPKELPELEDAQVGKVVMRIAPNVNGPMHIGHSRGIVINWLYCQKYKGRFILKLDDTDPDTKPALAWVYDSHIKDTEWLTGKRPEVICSSDRVKDHYKYAEELIKLNGAYTCTCSREKSQESRREGKACVHRSQPAEKSLKEWRDMLAGKYKKGDIVLKVKADIENPNPALRDWIAFRVTESAHPRHPEYKVWPMMEFANGIDDHLIGMTHIIKGKEHITSVERQKFMYNYFKWQFPHVLFWGRVKIIQNGEEMKISKTGMKKGIEEGKYSGWDDPRLPTLAGMRKRGIKPQAIIEFWKEIGLSERDIKADMDKLEIINKKYL